MTLAPIALFTFKKVSPLKATIAALQRNYLAKDSELVVFSDGAKKSHDVQQVEQVRAYLKTLTGFKKVTLQISETNKGLATSIIEGVTQLLALHETVIVLEDDLVTSPNFLNFMNAGLDYYKKNTSILSISGYTPQLKVNKEYAFDTYFTQRASSWGWATYREQWNKVDWRVSDYENFKVDQQAKKKFNQMGSDMSFMLSKQMSGKIDSWAIRWCYHQYRNNLFSVFPTRSKIENIGFMAGATHTTGKNESSRFATLLDTSNKTHFDFNPNIALEKRFIKYFVKPYSLKTRVYYKLKGLFRL